MGCAAKYMCYLLFSSGELDAVGAVRSMKWKEWCDARVGFFVPDRCRVGIISSADFR